MRFVGYTGTQVGMTEHQRREVRRLLEEYRARGYRGFRHGDCIGGDEQAHEIALSLGYEVHIHPSKDKRKRAFCRGAFKVYPVRPPLRRNDDIVELSGVVIAAPRRAREELRSGTWSTIRRCWKTGTTLHVIAP